MTSAGLEELKKLINEADAKRIELIATVSQSEHAFGRAERRLRLAQWFIIRLFTRGSLPKLVQLATEAASALTSARQQLAGCSVEIDFAFDDSTLNSFAALVRSFKSLAASQKIWDITASVLANRFVERTVAHHNVSRTLANLSFGQSDIIDTKYRALHFTNSNGNDIFIYPGFVMMPTASKDFALIDVRELQVSFSESDFIEETESVPNDSEVVGTTWKKANKDGSQDRRFNNNFQIPIVKYGQLELRSATGLWEVYQFSNYAERVLQSGIVRIPESVVSARSTLQESNSCVARRAR